MPRVYVTLNLDALQPYTAAPQVKRRSQIFANTRTIVGCTDNTYNSTQSRQITGGKAWRRQLSNPGSTEDDDSRWAVNDGVARCGTGVVRELKDSQSRWSCERALGRHAQVTKAKTNTNTGGLSRWVNWRATSLAATQNNWIHCRPTSTSGAAALTECSHFLLRRRRPPFSHETKLIDNFSLSTLRLSFHSLLFRAVWSRQAKQQQSARRLALRRSLARGSSSSSPSSSSFSTRSAAAVAAAAVDVGAESRAAT